MFLKSFGGCVAVIGLRGRGLGLGLLLQLVLGLGLGLLPPLARVLGFPPLFFSLFSSFLCSLSSILRISMFPLLLLLGCPTFCRVFMCAHVHACMHAHMRTALGAVHSALCACVRLCVPSGRIARCLLDPSLGRDSYQMNRSPRSPRSCPPCPSPMPPFTQSVSRSVDRKRINA